MTKSLEAGTHGSRLLRQQVKSAATVAKEVGTTFVKTSKGNTMDEDVIDLLKAHEYFRGVSDTVLGEIARFGTIANYDAAAVDFSECGVGNVAKVFMCLE